MRIVARRVDAAPVAVATSVAGESCIIVVMHVYKRTFPKQHFHTCYSSMPHGKVVLFPTMILTTAAILSMITLCSCAVVEAKSVGYYQAGFWPNCVYFYGGYEEPVILFQEDSARKVAMSFGLIACIVGTGAMIALWPITCRPYSKMWIRIISSIVIFAFVSQLITLSLLGTDFCKTFGCRLGWAGVMSIIAAILWLIGAIGVCIIPTPIEISQPTSETIQITETMQPDGSKVTEKITTSPNGTKTVERTIRSPLDTRGGAEIPLDVDRDGVIDAVAVVAVP